MASPNLTYLHRNSQDQSIDKDVLFDARLVPVAAIVEEGHGIFLGIQPGDRELNLEPLVLFKGTFLGTTMALKLSQLTAPAVREKIVNKIAEYLLGEGDINALTLRALDRGIINHKAEETALNKRPWRNRQAGFVFLLELLTVSMLMLILAAVSVPNLYRIKLNQQAVAARDRVQLVARAKANIALCSADPTCTPSPAVAALVPQPGTTITTGGYTFTESTDGSTYTATPTNPQTQQPTFTVGADGVVH